jgi:hypothetical protein
MTGMRTTPPDPPRPDLTKVRVFGVSGGWIRVWVNGVLIQESGEVSS